MTMLLAAYFFTEIVKFPNHSKVVFYPEEFGAAALWAFWWGEKINDDDYNYFLFSWYFYWVNIHDTSKVMYKRIFVFYFCMKKLFDFQINCRCTRKVSVSWSGRDSPSLHHGCMWTILKENGVPLMTFSRGKTPAFRHRYTSVALQPVASPS